jgi:hypothetical protein
MKLRTWQARSRLGFVLLRNHSKYCYRQ